MTPTVIGLQVGLVLGIAAAFGGFSALAIVALLGALGAIAGRFAGGELNLAMWSGGSDRRLR